MAGMVLNDCKVELNNVDLGSHAKSVEINGEYEVIDATGFGDAARVRILGFKEWTATIALNDDITDNGINEQIFNIWDAGVPVPLKVRAIDAAKGPSNPSFEGNVIMPTAPLFSAAVGQLSEKTLNLQGTGGLLRVVA